MSHIFRLASPPVKDLIPQICYTFSNPTCQLFKISRLQLFRASRIPGFRDISLMAVQQYLGEIMFGIVLILTCSLVHVYVFWRVSSMPFIKRHISLKYLLAAGIIMWILLFSGFFFSHDRAGILASALELFAMTWMAVLFLVFISVFTADIITGFGLFFPGPAVCLRGFALSTGLLISLAAFIQGYRAPVIVKYDLQIMDLPYKLDGTTIIALSDLHVGSQLGNKWLASRVAQVNEQKPDLIVLLGDIVEGYGNKDQDAFASTLGRLSAPLGIWAVLGNHETFGGRDATGSISIFEKAGVSVLRGGWKELRPGLVIAGVDPVHRPGGGEGKAPDSVSSSLEGRPDGAVILLSHYPQLVEEAAGAGADLMLCGHTHGGQIWPFNYIVQRFYPFLAGKYEINGMSVIVSRGAGTWGPRMRLWKPGEVLEVVLHAGDVRT